MNGYIYFIKDEIDDIVKIGKTNDIDKRMSRLSTSNINLKLLCFFQVDDYTKAENFFHNYFSSFHIKKEWFNIPDDFDLSEKKLKDIYERSKSRNFNIYDFKIRVDGNGYFCASDMVNAGNKWRFANDLKQFNYSQWLKNPTTAEFIKALKNVSKLAKPIIKNNRGSISWLHPYVAINLINKLFPKYNIIDNDYLYSCLIKYRNDSGDSYKKMCGALYNTISNKSKFEDEIKDFAIKIKKECGVDDWQSASQEQLKLRDKIHDNIALLSDILRDRELLLETAIRKAKENK